VRAEYRRSVLLWAVACGALVPAYFLGAAEVSHFAWDFHAYYAAAEAALDGQAFVGIDPGPPGVSYVYPPISVLLFLPQAAAGDWQVAFLLQTALNVAAALGLAALVLRTVEAERGRLPAVDRVLIGAFCVGSAPIVAVFGQGQVDALIALALAGAFVALERRRHGVAGGLLGAAALVKVFPAALGLWLVWRRAWRALAAAVATGLSGLAVGGLLFGLDAYARYFEVLAGRSRIAEFAGTVSPNFFAMSLYRPLSQLVPAADPVLYAPLSVLAVAPVAGLVARRERTLTDRLATYLVAVAAMLLVSPASNVLYVVYVYFPLLCLLHLDGAGPGQSLLVAGIAALAFPVQPAHVGTALTAVGAPASVSAAVVGVVRPVLTVASLPLLGLVAVLAWCALRAVRRRDAPAVEVRPARAD